MATQILALPLLGFEWETWTGEDWVLSIPVWANDDGVTPVPLDGIDFDLHIREEPDSNLPIVALSTRDRTMTILGADRNILAWAAPQARMNVLRVGRRACGIRATADNYSRFLVIANINHDYGPVR